MPRPIESKSLQRQSHEETVHAMRAQLVGIQAQHRKIMEDANRMLKMLSPHIGEIVLYRLLEGGSYGDGRPAIVVRIHEHEGDKTRCELRVVLSEIDVGYDPCVPNSRHGDQPGEWLPLADRLVADQHLHERAAVPG